MCQLCHDRPRRKLATLAARRDFLRERIAAAAAVGKEYTWDKAEMAALDWVLLVMAEHLEGHSMLDSSSNSLTLQA